MSRRTETATRFLKAATPTLVGLAGVALLALPIRLFWGVVPTPILPLIVVFFWAIYAPSYLPAGSVFAIGLLQDFLTGAPLGLWPAVYLFTQYLVLSQRSYFLGRELRVVWFGFAFVAGAASFVVWAVMSLMSGGVLPAQALLWQAVVTAAVYPVFARLFGGLHRRVVVEA
jgi:rod shape-determining protein MreD